MPSSLRNSRVHSRLTWGGNRCRFCFALRTVLKLTSQQRPSLPRCALVADAGTQNPIHCGKAHAGEAFATPLSPNQPDRVRTTTRARSSDCAQRARESFARDEQMNDADQGPGEYQVGG